MELDRAWFDKAVGAIPESAVVFQMGFMGARDRPAVRLCLSNLDPGRQLRWLAAIGWPGDLGRLRETLAPLASVSGGILLDVDFLPEGVGPALGLEIYPAERTLDMEIWRPLFDELLALGLARRDKLEALADFPSYQRFRQQGAWLRDPPIGFPFLVTNLHHLKLVAAGRTMIDAKAYLGVYHPVMDYSSSLGHGADEEFGGWM